MNNPKPMIGNQGYARPSSSLSHPSRYHPHAAQQAYIRSLSAAPTYPPSTYGPYPSMGAGGALQPTAPALPAPTEAAATPQSQGALNSLASLFTGGGEGSSGGFNIGQIKQVIDRLGGVDGILETVTKVQKVMQSVQQVAPLVKTLMGSLGSKKTSHADFSDDEPVRKRRRRRRRKTTSNRRKRRR